MPPGKLGAQAGHAYLESYLAAASVDPALAEAYRAGDVDHPERYGTKVLLAAPSLERLLDAHRAAVTAGIPCALITDAEHVLPPHFSGQPIITALGIGPALRSAAHSITKRFPSVR
jgi:peptidyl-tRNA hydrolase